MNNKRQIVSTSHKRGEKMEITKRKDGRWQYCYTPAKGKKQKYIYSSAKTKKQAEKEILEKYKNAVEIKDNGRDFYFVADNWNSDYRTRHSDLNYRKNLRAAYERIIEYFGKEVYIKDLTAVELNLFINKLILKGYSKKTIATHKSVLNMIFNYAILNGYITYNPMQDIKLPGGLPKKQREMPATDDIKVVSSHFEGFDLLPFFLLYTGCRKSEALAIRSEDIDFDKKTIKIRNHVIHDGNKPIFEPVLKTESAEREIILLDRLAEVIPKKFNGFLFSMAGDGKDPLTKRAYENRLKKYCNTYNVNITAHQLRHGYATMLFEAGVDVKDAQELMGHSDINLTRQIYTHIRSERKKETAKKLNAFNF